MEQPLLRLLIQEKIADGRLRSAPLPRVWDGPGTGQPCDGCSEPRTHAQTVVENLDAGSRAVRFHVACFHVWNVEREMGGQVPSVRLPARSASEPGRPSEPAMGTQRAGSPSDQLRVPGKLDGTASRIGRELVGPRVLASAA
jgi:hypothetical protein